MYLEKHVNNLSELRINNNSWIEWKKMIIKGSARRSLYDYVLFVYMCMHACIIII